MKRLLQSKLRILTLLASTLLCGLNSGPFIVIENYGNWKTLSIGSKSAYITGLWDGYLVFTTDHAVKKKNKTICDTDAIITVSDLVEVIDYLYEQEIYRSFSPANLLKDVGLQRLCSN